LKIASYNVNSIRSRLHIVLPWLQNNKPDYFCMQETKVEDAKFPVAEFEELGYQIVFRGRPHRYQRLYHRYRSRADRQDTSGDHGKFQSRVCGEG